MYCHAAAAFWGVDAMPILQALLDAFNKTRAPEDNGGDGYGSTADRCVF